MKLDTNTATETISKHLNEGAAAREKLAAEHSSEIIAVAEHIATQLKAGHKLLICGNGGSAADCQHMAAELTCRLTHDYIRPGIAAIALTTDTSCITAYGNDCGFDGVFSRQVEAIGAKGDVLLGISTSGSSKNVVLAFEAANAKGISTVALCGMKGSLLEMANLSIRIPTTHNQLVQEAHLAVEHLLCHFIERLLYPQ